VTILSAVAASLCCILPVAVAFLGVGSAALGAWMQPARPYLLGVTVLCLGLAFYQAYRPLKCAAGDGCAAPPSRRRQRVLLWIMAPIALAFLAFPHYVEWLL
jgi:hypothetical protein